MSSDDRVEDDEVLVSPASSALKRSIRRALGKQKRARKKLGLKPVHDLRVALRRCRSLAEGFSAIDPDPVWRRLRKASKEQQSGLSDLRDVQVLANWVEPLRLTAGPAGTTLAKHLRKRERRAKREARSSLKSFPRKRWKRWLRRLPVRAELIPVNECRLTQLVLEQLTRVRDLHDLLDERAGPGELARLACDREALPIHGGELLAGKERSLERRTPARAGFAWRRSRPGRLARSHRAAFAQKIAAETGFIPMAGAH